MGSQSLLSLGALLLLSLLSLQFNSSVLGNSTTEIEDKVYLTAFSLADDLIEEIKEKAFDEKTIDFQAIALNQLTSADMLTFESGESWPNFDDIDDYNGYQKEIDLPHAEGYNLTCKVNYVDSNGNDLTTQSYFKKVTITVTSKYLSSPFYMSFIFSLHSKN
jgi:hypothetical protein